MAGRLNRWRRLVGGPSHPRQKCRSRTLPSTRQPFAALGVLDAPSEGEDIVADYNSMSLTLGQHPLSQLRPVLLEQRLVPAAMLMSYRSGWLARSC